LFGYVQLATVLHAAPVAGCVSGQGLQRQRPASQSQKRLPYVHPPPSAPTRPRQAAPLLGMTDGQVQRRDPPLSEHVHT
jgi:hypothetical protein